MPGTPADVRGTVTAPAHMITSGSWRGESGGRLDSVGLVYSVIVKPPIAGADLYVAVASLGNRSVLRVDAVVTYLPSRPVDLTIGHAVSLTISATPPGMDTPPPASLGPVTTVDPAKIAAVAAVVNSAQPQLPGTHSCPMMVGGAVRLEFRAANGSSVARVVIGLSGCGGIEVTTTGGATGGVSGGIDDAEYIVKILGLNWNLRR